MARYTLERLLRRGLSQDEEEIASNLLSGHITQLLGVGRQPDSKTIPRLKSLLVPDVYEVTAVFGCRSEGFKGTLLCQAFQERFGEVNNNLAPILLEPYGFFCGLR